MKKRGQAALEYLVTYGWAFMAALIAIGAMSYFGLINPSSLLPNRCSFGNQLECTEYEIYANGTVNIEFRNNFGKPIEIEYIELVNGGPVIFSGPILINASASRIISFEISPGDTQADGDKQELNLVLNFTRADIASVSHTLSGSVFVTVKP